MEIDFASGAVEYFEQLRADKTLIRLDRPKQYSTVKEPALVRHLLRIPDNAMKPTLAVTDRL